MNRSLLVVGVAGLVACGGMLPLIESDAGMEEDGSVQEAAADVALDEAVAEADAAVVTCASDQVLCDGGCYANDINHCGPSCASCDAPAYSTATCDGTSCGFTCNFLQCGSDCVDPTSDPLNCGECGHDCLGETCTSGACTPESLFSGVQAAAISVDSTNLYWVNYGYDIVKAPKGGGTSTTLATHISFIVIALAVGESNLYWSSVYGIGSVPIAGGTPTVAPSNNTTWPCVPYLGPDAIYYGDYSQASDVYAMPYDGGPPVGVIPTTDTIAGAVYTPTYIYFAAGDPGPTIWRASTAAPDAGSEAVFTGDAGFSGFPPFVMNDGGNAFVQTQKGIWDVPLDGGTQTKMTAINTIWLAADSSNVYTANSAAIYRTPIGGTTSTVVYQPPTQNITAIAIDDKYVYFGYTGTGTGIYRVAK